MGSLTFILFVLMQNVCILTFRLCYHFYLRHVFCRMFVRSAQKSYQIMKRRSRTSLKSICILMRRSVIVLLEVVWTDFSFDLIFSLPCLPGQVAKHSLFFFRLLWCQGSQWGLDSCMGEERRNDHFTCWNLSPLYVGWEQLY